jgi:hypothetical protein
MVNTLPAYITLCQDLSATLAFGKAPISKNMLSYTFFLKEARGIPGKIFRSYPARL